MTLRLLLAIPTLDRGGPDRVFADLLCHFDRERIRPGVFVTSTGGYHFERLPADVAVLVNGTRHPLDGKYPVAGLVQAARSFRPDVILSTLRMVPTATAARPFLRGVAHVARVANQVGDQFDDLAHRNRLRADAVRRMTGASLRLADHVVCQSRRMADDLRRFADLSAISVIGNGIDTGAIPIPDDTSPNPLRGPPRLLFVGRLVPQKGVDVLIEAFRAVAPAYPQAVLTLVGDGPQRAELQTRVDAAGLRDRVEFRGQVTDPFPYLRGADVVVAPSRYEGFSNVVLEALVCGTPVVATADSGTSDEVVRPGFNGQLAATADSALVAEAIRRQLRQPVPPRAELAADVARRFSSADVARTYEALAYTVLEHRRHGLSTRWRSRPVWMGGR